MGDSFGEQGGFPDAPEIKVHLVLVLALKVNPSWSFQTGQSMGGNRGWTLCLFLTDLTAFWRTSARASPSPCPGVITVVISVSASSRLPTHDLELTSLWHYSCLLPVLCLVDEKRPRTQGSCSDLCLLHKLCKPVAVLMYEHQFSHLKNMCVCVYTHTSLTVLLWRIEVMSIIYPARCLKCLQQGHLSWPFHSWPTCCLPFTPFSVLKISAEGKHSAFELSFWNQVTVSLQLPGELPGWNQKLALIEGGQRPEEEANHSRLVGGKFNKQGNLHTYKTCLGWPQKEYISASACQHLEELI